MDTLIACFGILNDASLKYIVVVFKNFNNRSKVFGIFNKRSKVC